MYAMCRWFDNTLFTMFRGKRCYDGGLTNFIPLPPTQHGVRVCCFPSKQITTIYDIGISPDNYEDWPHTLQEMLSWAFEPADDKLLLEFIGMSTHAQLHSRQCSAQCHSCAGMPVHVLRKPSCTERFAKVVLYNCIIVHLSTHEPYCCQAKCAIMLLHWFKSSLHVTHLV